MAVNWDAVFKDIADGMKQVAAAKKHNIHPDSITRKKRQMKKQTKKTDKQTEKQTPIDVDAIMKGLEEMGLTDEPDQKQTETDLKESYERAMKESEEKFLVVERKRIERKHQKPDIPDQKQTVDLRDIKDEFQLWLVNLDAKKYSSNRAAILNRVQKFKRPALIDGTINLLAEFLKINKIELKK